LFAVATELANMTVSHSCIQQTSHDKYIEDWRFGLLTPFAWRPEIVTPAMKYMIQLQVSIVTFFNCPFSGQPERLFLSPMGSLDGRVTAQWFHSVPRQANGNWGPLFHFLPASYIIWSFWPANYSAFY
jgi:hypothetical protein